MKIEPIAIECFEQARSDYSKLGKPVPPETMAYIMGLSQAESLKRIADALDGLSPNGSVLYWLETIASAASAGRS